MSSANIQRRISVWPTIIPVNSSECRKIIATTSTTRRNKSALIGQPCLTPFESLKKEDMWPLFETQLSISEYKVFSAYCDRSNIIVDEQNGFRPGRSCEEYIFTLTTIIRNQFAKSKPLFTSFIDLKKAFDWVDRDLLMYRLLTYGINGNIYNAIKSLYQHTMPSVHLNEYMSEWFPVTSGVKQGDNLSPILFCLYINDLTLTLKENNIGVNIDGHTICILLYADDLQTLLDIAQDWCYKWKLNINVEKSKVMHFRPDKKKQSNVNFSFGDMPLQYCESYKYLRIYLDPHLKFNCCIKTLADSGGRALGSLLSKFKHLKDVRYKAYTKMYTSQISTILEYCSSIWAHTKASECDLVQNRAMQYFTGSAWVHPCSCSKWGDGLVTL